MWVTTWHSLIVLVREGPLTPGLRPLHVHKIAICPIGTFGTISTCLPSAVRPKRRVHSTAILVVLLICAARALLAVGCCF